MSIASIVVGDGARRRCARRSSATTTSATSATRSMTCSRIVLVDDVARDPLPGEPRRDREAGDDDRARRPRATHGGAAWARGSAYVHRPAAAASAGCRRAVIASYIRSGASTPSRSSPLRSTWPVASLSHSRVRCTVVDRLVAERDHPAVVVPAVVEPGELFEVAGDAVRLAHLGGERDDARELLQRAEQRRLGLVVEQLGRERRCGRRRMPRRCARRCACARARTARRRRGCRSCACAAARDRA